MRDRGFNLSKWEASPNRGENHQCLKTLVRTVCCGDISTESWKLLTFIGFSGFLWLPARFINIWQTIPNPSVPYNSCQHNTYEGIDLMENEVDMLIKLDHCRSN